PIAVGELRTGGTRSGGVRNAGRGVSGRRAPDARRSRPHRLPRARPRRRGLRGLRRRASVERVPGVEHGTPRRRTGQGLHVVDRGGTASAPLRRSHRRGPRGLFVSDLHEDEPLDAVARAADAWMARRAAETPVMAAGDRGRDVPRRWYVRMTGEEKSVTTVWITVRQRTIRYETYVLPAPEENHAQFYEHLLRRNDHLVG